MSKLKIKAEKGFIQILPSEDNSVHVELKLILKHEELSVAKKEMAYVRYTMTESGKDLILANSIVLPAKSEEEGLQSIFRVEYFVKVPDNISIDVSNVFGSVTIQNISANISTILEYCDLNIKNTEGKFYVNTQIGDINLNNVKSDVNIISSYASIKLNDNSGTVIVTAEYGDISSVITTARQNLIVKANAANVDIFNKKCYECTLNLVAKHGDIHMDSTCYIKTESKYKQTKSQNAMSTVYLAKGNSSNIHIETKYANISLY